MLVGDVLEVIANLFLIGRQIYLLVEVWGPCKRMGPEYADLLGLETAPCSGSWIQRVIMLLSEDEKDAQFEEGGSDSYHLL